MGLHSPLNKRGNGKTVVARFLAGSALSSLLFMGLVLIPFPTGWEVGTAIVGITSSGLQDGIIAGNCKAYTLSTGEERPGTPGECRTGGNTWTFDIDPRTYGTPSLLITSQQPRHTDAGGTATDHDKPADSRVVTRQRDTFYVDRHIFMFEFQVNTIADVQKVRCEIEGGCIFDHETSASTPPITVDFRVLNSRVGAPFDGSSFILFGINPWQGIRQPDANTIRFDQWVGIMQATIFRVEGNKVPNAPGSQDFPWAVEKLLSEGANPNMFTVAGAELVTVNDPQSVPLDQRIPSSVLIELPYKLTAGAAVKRVLLGGVNDIAPINVFAKYIVRVDVAIVTGFTPQLDYIDANNNNVRDSGEFTFIDKNNDNVWTQGADEAVEGTPPPPTIEDPPSKDDLTTVPPPSGLQTGCPPNCPPTIQPPPDIFFPSCNFFDFECRLANWSKFPTDLGLMFGLLLPIIAIVAIAFVGLAVFGVAVGRRRGK